MKPRTFAPHKLDIGAFIESGELMQGQAPVADLARLAHGLAKDFDLASLPDVSWSAQGRLEAQRVGGPHLWLDLSAQAELAWDCQRCLHAVAEPVEVHCSIRFVKDEAAAAELDADSEDDVLALSKQFDLMALIEDELIMAQPLVPRHAQCPIDVSVHMRADELPATGEAVPGAAEQGGAPDASLTASGRPNPFAVLAALKKSKA
jgi:uncharacterized protein